MPRVWKKECMLSARNGATTPSPRLVGYSYLLSIYRKSSAQLRNLSNTCRLRKVKCDETTPVCLRCQKAGRFCDRSQKESPRQSVPGQNGSQGLGHDLPSPSDPRQALQRREVARYFHHYFVLARWYDLSDPDSTFGTKVPEAALENPLLFSAVIASAAMHLSRTSLQGARRAAEFYHSHCVSALIALKENDESLSLGIPLAATCLLRAYESLSEEIDPNRHLLGAYSLASNYELLAASPKTGLFMAGFWNYLREDITYSLFEQRPLKMNLSRISLVNRFDADHDYLNAISILLGRIINLALGGDATRQDWETNSRLVDEWFDHLPSRFQPFSHIYDDDTKQFPSIWYLQDCHASAMHYYYVCMTLICLRAPEFGVIPQLKDIDDQLEKYAFEIVGSAFASDSAPVIVNAFGPICYCCRFLRNEVQRDELIRSIHGTRKEIGWPGHVIIQKLKSHWSS